MADVTPPLDTIRPATPGEHEELEQLRRLAAGLSPAYHLFHGVDWAQARPQGDQHGELDVVVVNQAGDVAVLEVKSGEVQLGPQGVHKRYQGQLKDLGRQAAFQFQGIHHRLKAEGLEVRLLHLLVLPQQRVDDTGSVAFPRERIADAEDCQDLAGFIARRLGPGAPHPSGERVRAFFANRLRLTDDVAVVAGRLEQRVRLISGGLAEWVPRLHCPGGVLRVVGTAGSGKTQLALRLLRDAVAGLLVETSLLAPLAAAWLLRRYTNSTVPVWDSLITALSLVAQYMMTRKWIENWAVWILANCLSVGLLITKGLYVASALYAVYQVLCIMGWVEWRRALATSSAE